jgi:serine/threonine-protein kinase
MHAELLDFVRGVFFAGVLLVAGFLSCLTAMRFAIRGSEVRVPNVVGRKVAEGTRILNASALRLKVESQRYDDRISKDQILFQNPPADSNLKRDSHVRVVVSLGAKRIPVPLLEGESLRVSQIALLRRGLTLGLTSTISSETEEKDRILAQDPPPEAGFARSSQMSLLVSSGKQPRQFLMPDLIGRVSDEVTGEFAGLGLKLGTVTEQPVPDLPRGTILKQSPPPGRKVVEGGTIDFEVSQ